MQSIDEEVAEQMHLCQAIGATVHIRGSDLSPVIEFREKHTNKVIGGIELKRRIAQLKPEA